MEKALTKVGSLKAGTFWVSKKAKEEISNISQDLSVMLPFPFSFFFNFVCRVLLVLTFDELFLCI